MRRNQRINEVQAYTECSINITSVQDAGEVSPYRVTTKFENRLRHLRRRPVFDNG